jgi:hypothetical protein
MRWRVAALSLAAIGLARAQGDSSGAFDRLKALAGRWEADSPAGGKLANSIVLVSKGTAIEEAIGTPEDQPRGWTRLNYANHFTEVWTKRESGKDTVFTLDFTRK